MSTKVFMLEMSEVVHRHLRRSASDWDYESTPAVNRNPCPLGWCHNAEVFLDKIVVAVPDGYETDERMTSGDLFTHDADLWPTACQCGYVFRPEDGWQLSVDRLYRRVDNGELMRLHEAPPGAMWFADWMLLEGSNVYRGPDGHSLVVRLPDRHDWNADGRANNCDRRDDDAHKCWVRHGDPRTGVITVDKNGVTCSAGAGSILTPKWHGFLRNGELVSC